MKKYKIIIPKYVVPITVLAIALNILRFVLFGKLTLIYILWNIILAFIPYIISSFLFVYSKEEKVNKLLFISGFILWLLFIPNAPYIITDFIHLGDTRSIPLLFDIIMLFSSTVIGLVFFCRSLFHIEQIIKTKYSYKTTSLIMGFIILLISFGIFLGRFLRFNSWDIFINHLSIIKNVWKVFTEPSGGVGVYFYTLLFFFFLIVVYRTYKILNIKSIN